MVDVYESRTRQPEYIEKRAEQLLTSVYGDPSAVQKEGESAEDFQLRKFGRAGVSQPIPAFQFAGFTPEQQQAFQLASSGIGSYAPYLSQAMTSAGLGGASLAGALPQIMGATQGFTPTAATMQQWMDPYQQQVTQEALKEYDVQAQLAKSGLASQAQKAGAFGGSRFGVQEAELGKNLQDIKSRRVFEDLSRNYQQAQRAAMGAQEAQQRRQLQAGAQMGGIGQQFGQLGKMQAGLGALGTQLGQSDIQQLLGVGGMQQQLGQGMLEAQRQQQLMAQREPYTRLGFASDILRGAPSGQISYTQQPQTNPYAQALGLGIAGLGAMGQYGQAFPQSGLGNFMGNIF
jgi:hypothetical protein